MKCSYLTVYEGPPGTHYTCALFAPSASSKGDILYVGNNDGLLYYFVVSKNLLINRQDELNPGEVGGGNHKSSVTCLLHSKHPGLAGTSICEKGGLMFSGSKDRTVKIWQSAGTFKPLIQTLYGHTGQVSGLCDGCDGTVLSCSLDGTIRIWRPQRGRELMLKPFFECINVVAASKDTEVWLTCIAVNATNHWACFAANSQGDVTVFRKSKDGLFGSSIYATGEASVSTAAAASHFSVLGSTSTQPYLSTHEVWPRVHGLGISKIFVEEDTNLVVTLSFDGTSKILDASCGYALCARLDDASRSLIQARQPRLPRPACTRFWHAWMHISRHPSSRLLPYIAAPAPLPHISCPSPWPLPSSCLPLRRLSLCSPLSLLCPTSFCTSSRYKKRARNLWQKSLFVDRRPDPRVRLDRRPARRAARGPPSGGDPSPFVVGVARCFLRCTMYLPFRR